MAAEMRSLPGRAEPAPVAGCLRAAPCRHRCGARGTVCSRVRCENTWRGQQHRAEGAPGHPVDTSHMQTLRPVPGPELQGPITLSFLCSQENLCIALQPRGTMPPDPWGLCPESLWAVDRGGARQPPLPSRHCVRPFLHTLDQRRGKLDLVPSSETNPSFQWGVSLHPQSGI